MRELSHGGRCANLAMRQFCLGVQGHGTGGHDYEQVVILVPIENDFAESALIVRARRNALVPGSQKITPGKLGALQGHSSPTALRVLKII